MGEPLAWYPWGAGRGLQLSLSHSRSPLLECEGCRAPPVRFLGCRSRDLGSAARNPCAKARGGPGATAAAPASRLQLAPPAGPAAMSGFSPELIDYLEGKISFEEFERRREERKSREKVGPAPPPPPGLEGELCVPGGGRPQRAGGALEP